MRLFVIRLWYVVWWCFVVSYGVVWYGVGWGGVVSCGVVWGGEGCRTVIAHGRGFAYEPPITVDNVLVISRCCSRCFAVSWGRAHLHLSTRLRNGALCRRVCGSCLWSNTGACGGPASLADILHLGSPTLSFSSRAPSPKSPRHPMIVPPHRRNSPVNERDSGNDSRQESKKGGGRRTDREREGQG